MLPNLTEELSLYAAGHTLIAGIDEAGRGAWAGPVCAGAVVLPLERPDLVDALDGVRDSKLLLPVEREALLPVIRAVALGVGVGWADPGEVDALGIVPATCLAMERAVSALPQRPDALLLDYVRLPGNLLPQRAFPKADLRCLSVAAASIVAKVSRDRLMAELDARYPGYGLAQHKGYGTRAHRAALARLGACALHRVSWQAVRSVAGAGTERQDS